MSHSLEWVKSYCRTVTNVSMESLEKYCSSQLHDQRVQRSKMKVKEKTTFCRYLMPKNKRDDKNILKLLSTYNKRPSHMRDRKIVRREKKRQIKEATNIVSTCDVCKTFPNLTVHFECVFFYFFLSRALHHNSCRCSYRTVKWHREAKR